MTEYVYVAPATTRTGKVKRYHTNPDCRNLGDAIEYPAHLVTDDGWRECKVCSGQVDTGHGGNRDIYQAAVNYDG